MPPTKVGPIHLDTHYTPNTGIALDDQVPFQHEASALPDGHGQNFEPYSDLVPSESPPPYSPADDDRLELPSLEQQQQAQHQQETPSPIPPSVARGNIVNCHKIPGGRVVNSCRGRKSSTISLYPPLSSDPEALTSFVWAQADLAPHPIIRVYGQHTVTRTVADSKGKTSYQTETVVDFDFRIDGSDILLQNLAPASQNLTTTPGQPSDSAFRVLNVIQDGDGKSAYRGGRFKSKRRCRSHLQPHDVEAAAATDCSDQQTPSLDEWCRRYCADPAKMKSFTLRRDLMNWNFSAIKQHITSIVRSTGYRGHITISQKTYYTQVTVYSPSLLNRMRNNACIWWLCVILPWWIITWPILLILERRYEIICVEHWVSRNGQYATNLGNEQQWADTFAPVIRAAALSRRWTSELVTCADSMRISNVSTERSSCLPSPSSRMGEVVWANSVVGVVSGGAHVSREWDQVLGWGSNR